MFNILWINVHQHHQQQGLKEVINNNSIINNFFLHQDLSITSVAPLNNIIINQCIIEFLINVKSFQIVNIILPPSNSNFLKELEILQDIIPFFSIYYGEIPPIDKEYFINNEIKYLGNVKDVDDANDNVNVNDNSDGHGYHPHHHPLISPILIKLKKESKPKHLKELEFIKHPMEYLLLPLKIKLLNNSQEKIEHNDVFHFESLNLYAIQTIEDCIRLIEPAFMDPLILLRKKKNFYRDKKDSSSDAGVFDTSITLRNWKPLQTLRKETDSHQHCMTTMSQPIEVKKGLNIEMDNKAALKRLLHLSLRQMGIERGCHQEFDTIWQHLYNGCLFSFRKEISNVPIEQQTILKVIRSNLNFLNP